MDSAALRRLGRSAARLARTRYPGFLFGRDVPPAEIPVFTYHDVEADVLKEDLDFLERNGYRTLALEELIERSSSAAGRRDRCVLLSFDDARRSFRDVVYPILRERGARATLFVPTFWMSDDREANADAVPRPDRSLFMTWAELAECDRSGIVDVESHAHRHALVFTSTRLAGFATPRALAQHDLFDWPLRRRHDADVSGRPPLGTPVYEAQPLLSAERRVFEPEAAAEACRRHVEAEGGSRFFDRADAAAELRAVHDEAVSRSDGAVTVTGADFRRQLEAELDAAVRVFADRLGRRPRRFAYPWMLGSPQSLALLADAGFDTAFGVALDFRRARTEQSPLRLLGRYKSDWLRFLPGRGRRRLQDVLPEKLAAFVRTQHLAH